MPETASSSRFWLGTVVTVLIAAAIPLTILAVRNQQDISSSAAAQCGQAPVDVQFRKNTANNPDKPWKSGNNMNVVVGDILEVNCFAEAGEALLSGGKITGTVDGVAIDLQGLSEYYDGAQVRGYEITQAGTYKFDCKNNSGSCKNNDSFTVAGASPSPSASVSATPNPSCSTHAVSDLNKDCSSTIQDYDLFLRDFIDQQE